MALFMIFPAMVFLIILGVFLFSIIHMIRTNRRNSNSPELTVNARAVNKRHKVSGDHSRTSYYITFEFESGDRQEFHVRGTDSGMIVEGDSGLLTFQGTRYLGFERS